MPRIAKNLITGSLLLLSSLCRAGELRSFEAVEPHMGTLIRIKLYAANEEVATAGFRAAFERIAELDNELSDYKADSELNRLSRSAVHHPVSVSQDLFYVLAYSQELAAKTNGAFDVTLGPLTHLWREARRKGQVPDNAEIRARLGRCGFTKMHLDRAERTVILEEDGMQLDVGGIAKGYAADEVLRVLREHGIRAALVAASGDLAFMDAPPGEPGWKVGIDSLDAAGQPFARVLRISNAAVSTSGDTEQYLKDNGKRYSHIIDPQTGLGLTDRVTVTIVAPLGIEADATATAVSVLGMKAGLAFVEKDFRLAALFVQPDVARPKVVASRRFRQLGGLQ